MAHKSECRASALVIRAGDALDRRRAFSRGRARLEAIALDPAAAGATFRGATEDRRQGGARGGARRRARAVLTPESEARPMKTMLDSGDHCSCGACWRSAGRGMRQEAKSEAPSGESDSAGRGAARLYRAGARPAGGGGADAGLDLEPGGPAGAAGHRCQGVPAARRGLDCGDARAWPHRPTGR